jgi:hypothetical protein
MPDTISADVDRPQSLTVSDLVDRFFVLNPEHTRIWLDLDELHLAASREFPEPPKEIRCHTKDADGKVHVCVLDEDEISKSYEDRLALWPNRAAEWRELRATRLALLAVHNTRCEEVLERFGYDAAATLWEAIDKERDELIELIRNTRARSVRDVLAKMRLADHFEEFVAEARENPESPGVAPKMIGSAIADLERLAAAETATPRGFI